MVEYSSYGIIKYVEAHGQAMAKCNPLLTVNGLCG